MSRMTSNILIPFTGIQTRLVGDIKHNPCTPQKLGATLVMNGRANYHLPADIGRALVLTVVRPR